MKRSISIGRVLKLNVHKLKISPYPSLPKRGIKPPFAKGRQGGILLIMLSSLMRPSLMV
jgi:hypothetical protein